MSKRLLVMAGGTGGHVFPGLAVADELKKQGWHIHWLGTRERLEATLVPAAGYPISFIDVAGVRGNGLVRLLKAPFQIVRAIWQARAVIKRERPDVIIGLGGFASGPGGVAAWMMGKPLILHEQNAVPGMTNKILSKVASRVLTGFDNTFAEQASDKHKYRWVGNPVRADFYPDSPGAPAEAESETAATVRLNENRPLRLLVVGGSLGAKVLNDMVPRALEHLQSVDVRHQCGAGHMDAVEQTYKQSLGKKTDTHRWTVMEFEKDMAAAYRWADVVVCRAGALTVAEVAAAGVAAVFVPLPHAVDDHQTKNALTLAQIDAAYLLPQTELLEGGLVPILQELIAAPEKLSQMGARASTLARYQASQDVANHCIELAGQAA